MISIQFIIFDSCLPTKSLLCLTTLYSIAWKFELEYILDKPAFVTIGVQV